MNNTERQEERMESFRALNKIYSRSLDMLKANEAYLEENFSKIENINKILEKVREIQKGCPVNIDKIMGDTPNEYEKELENLKNEQDITNGWISYYKEISSQLYKTMNFMLGSNIQ